MIFKFESELPENYYKYETYQFESFLLLGKKGLGLGLPHSLYLRNHDKTSISSTLAEYIKGWNIEYRA